MIELRDQARTRWRSLLPMLGVEEQYLSGRNCPCPKCGGKDRFRFTDHESIGGWVCNGCGKGDGIELVQIMHNIGFEEAARMVREVLPDAVEGKPKTRITDDDRKAMVTRLWKGSKPLDGMDDASEYLRGRGLGEVRSKALRYHSECPNGVGEPRPAMLALVTAPGGKPYTFHRTFLEGGKRGERKLCPGELVSGSYIELAPAGETLGVAEGIETALAVTMRFGCPCWSLISAGNMERFEPPEGVKRLWIMADNDLKYGGQSAAYTLAHRLACCPDPLDIAVHIPPREGSDWADPQ